MNRRRRLGWVGFGAFVVLGCQDHAAPVAEQRRLEEGAIATVGQERILAETVGRIAATQKMAPAEAREVAIRDALFAAGAREQLPAQEVEAAETRVWARAMLRDIVISSRQGPITEDELGRATETYWTHFNRPRGFRTIHAVMLAPKNAPPETHAGARARIAEIREAWLPLVEKLKGTQAPQYDDDKMFRWNANTMTEPIKTELEEAAKAVVGELGLKVQQLPPVTAEGYLVDHDENRSGLDVDYSRTASQLEARGDLSEIVQSTSGWHVILLLEITPAKIVPEAQRKEALRGFIYRVRAQERVEALLGELRKSTKVPSNHAALLQLIQVGGEG